METPSKLTAWYQLSPSAQSPSAQPSSSETRDQSDTWQCSVTTLPNTGRSPSLRPSLETGRRAMQTCYLNLSPGAETSHHPILATDSPPRFTSIGPTDQVMIASNSIPGSARLRLCAGREQSTNSQRIEPRTLSYMQPQCQKGDWKTMENASGEPAAACGSWIPSPGIPPLVTDQSLWVYEQNMRDGVDVDQSTLFHETLVANMSYTEPWTLPEHDPYSLKTTLDFAHPNKYVDLPPNSFISHDRWPDCDFLHEPTESGCEQIDQTPGLSPDAWPLGTRWAEGSMPSEICNTSENLVIAPESLQMQHENQCQDGNITVGPVASPYSLLENQSCNTGLLYEKEELAPLWQPNKHLFSPADDSTQIFRPPCPESCQLPGATEIQSTLVNCLVTKNKSLDQKQDMSPKAAKITGWKPKKPLRIIRPKLSTPNPTDKGANVNICSKDGTKKGQVQGKYSSTTIESQENQDRKDAFLIQCKRAGMSYRQIKEKGQFAEAESTLRGRFRSLTKPKDHRVRKPEWHDTDASTPAILTRGVPSTNFNSDSTSCRSCR